MADPLPTNAGSDAGLDVRSRGSRRAALVVLGAAVLFAAPLALSRYFPGLDLPWHAAIIEVLHQRDPAAVEHAFLGYYEVGAPLSSYLTMYYGALGLALLVGDVAIALQLLIAIYVVTFVTSVARLSRAFGGSPLVALVAAPAAYSVTLEYGFLSYALAYPLTFYAWAVAREAMTRAGAAWPRMLVLALLVALVALSHPYAALVAITGVAVILGTHAAGRSRRALAGALACLLACVPAVAAVIALGGDSGGTSPLLSRAPLWSRLTAQQFTAPVEALAAAPVRLFGLVPVWARYALVPALLGAALIARWRGGAPTVDPGAGPGAGARRRALWWLLAVMTLAYLLTPFTFEWPRRWYGAQPRLLPVVWVVAVIAVRPHTRLAVRQAGAMLVASAAALAILIAALVPLAAEARDLRAVIVAAAPRARTLALVEQPPTREREPASPWRHAGAWVLVEHGGFVSNLPMNAPTAGNAGILVPVNGAPEGPPQPAAPRLGRARDFDPALHSGWDQILIRDLDPDRPHPYVTEGDGFSLVVRVGRWRLYRALP